MLRRILYKVKSAVDSNVPLYEAIYNTATFNLDYLKQKIHAARYPSKFGGMWTDRDDFETLMRQKLDSSSIDQSSEKLLREFRDKGRVLIKNAISPALIDSYLDDIEQYKNQATTSMLITAANLSEPTQYSKENMRNNKSVRIVDDFFFSEYSKQLLFHPSIAGFMESIFERKPILTQSLRFDYGSEQPIHQDTAFVRMNAPMKLAAVWIALEDIKKGTGELVYYPGSHTWEGYLFSGRFKHYDDHRDGIEQLDQWHRWIHEEARRRGVVEESFLAKKGDILIWHAALAHGGSTVTDTNASRLSLVGHYCPEGVRPLYHYYKPNQRKFYRYNQFKYSSSYYRS